MVLLCFGFVARTVLVTHQCFGFCWALLAQHQGFIFPPLCLLQQLGQGRAWSWRGHSWHSWPNWPKLTLFQAHQDNWRGGWAEVCFWEVAIALAEFVPSTLLLFLCLYLNPLLFPFSPASPQGREEAAGQCFSCWPGSALVNCRIWATLYYFFFSIYIKFAEESAHTGWCFLNLGTPNYVCFKINLPPILLTVFEVHINIPTTEFNYSKTNMLLSVSPYTLHSWKILFQAKESPPTRICMM